MTFTIDENIIFFSNILLDTFIINYTTILIYLCINIVICYNSTYLKYKILFLKQNLIKIIYVYIFIYWQNVDLFFTRKSILPCARMGFEKPNGQLPQLIFVIESINNDIYGNL